MNQQKLLQDFFSLPPIAQREVVDFVAFLKQRHRRHLPSSEHLPLIETEPFIGMWACRDEMADSSTWVRQMRQSEWS